MEELTRAQVLDLQTRQYGETLRSLIKRIGDEFDLNNRQIASLIGISTPMLSQVQTGARQGIKQPEAAMRLNALRLVCYDLRQGRIEKAEAWSLLESIRHASGEALMVLATPRNRATGVSLQWVRVVQQVLWAAASAEEIGQAATILDEFFPDLAEMLRVCGLAQTGEVVRYVERTFPELDGVPTASPVTPRSVRGGPSGVRVGTEGKSDAADKSFDGASGNATTTAPARPNSAPLTPESAAHAQFLRRTRQARTRPLTLHQEPEAVTWAREKSGLTKRALAEMIGISEQLVGDIESGWRTATPANLRKIADALNCPIVVLERKRWAHDS